MTAQRLLVHGELEVALEPFDPPAELGHGQVLVEVHHSLISPGTELSGVRGPRRAEPGPIGYTACGRVVGVGPGADPALDGQRVYVYPGDKECFGCHATHKVTAPDALFVPLPDDMPTDRACFARMVNIALTPFVLCGSQALQTVLVMGLGPVGQFISQVARIRGCRVIGLDLDGRRRQRAEQGGAHATVDAGDGDWVGRVRELTDGRGAELTVNATGVAATFPMAIEATATGGEVSTLGGARGEAAADLGPIFREIHSRHITVRGGWEMLMPRRPAPTLSISSTEEQLRLALRWLADGSIDLAPIWTHTIKPADMQEAYRALNSHNDEYLGVIVDWRRQPVEKVK